MGLFETFLQENDLGALIVDASARPPYPPRQDRARWDALPEGVRARLLALGDAAKRGYPPLPATAFLAFTRTGDRQAYETPYFDRRRKLLHAVLAECVTDDGGYLDAIVDGLWCICEETTWVVSAHNGSDHAGVRPARERPLPDIENPYIDLFCAQTAATLCSALYFVGDKLDAVSPLIARRVRRELETRVFLPFRTRDDFWWMGVVRRDLNNWTPWIVSNVLDAALMAVRDRALLTELLARAMRMLDRYLLSLPSDGGCDEGAGYWNMAGGSLLDCLELLHAATGGRADFFADPLIRAIGAFPVRAHIAGAYFWNFADCDAMPTLDGERLYAYGARTGSAALKALGAEVFSLKRAVEAPDTPQMNRVVKALFAGVNGAREGATRVNAGAAGAAGTSVDADAAGTSGGADATGANPPAFVALPALQAFAWRRGGLYLAIKGGHNAESHNHNDVGSFLCYADGEPEIVDAGNLTYTAKTFSAERYTLWNTRARNHNLPLIGGEEQCAGREYAARDVRADESGASMRLEAAYPAACGLASFTRQVTVGDGGFALSDEIALLSPQPVTWVFLLRHEPRVSAGEARFGRLALRFPKELTPRAEELPITDARMARNFPGSLWRLTLTAAPDTAHEARFFLQRS